MNASPYRGSPYGRESLVIVSFRSFLIALFGIVGLCFGFFIALILIGAISSSTEGQAETYYTPEIVANGEGVRTVQSGRAPVILKLNVIGVIGTEILNMHTFRQQLIESREGTFKNDRVKALLLHIESPGGTVVDADGIYRAIVTYKKRYNVPVYAYVDGLCASGGMYIAAAADKVYATDVSLVGSVGVITPPFFNVVELMKKVGVESLTVSAGKDKDALSPFHPWKEDEDKNMRDIIAYFYDHFVNVIVTNRPRVDKEKLIEVYGAQIFPANQAKEFGFVDHDEAVLSEVVKDLAKKIGIDNDYYQVIELNKRTWYTELFRGESSLLKGEIRHSLQLPPEADPRLMNQLLYLYRPGSK